MKKQCKSIWAIAKTEYISWLINPRMLIVIGYFIVISNVIINPMWEKFHMMGDAYINIFEPYIAVMNSPICILLAPLGLLLVTYDYPKVSNTCMFTLVRSGKLQWFLGQVLFALFASMSVSVMILVFMLVPMARVSYISNEWSTATLEFYEKHYELSTSAIANLIPPNVYFHAEPYESVLYSLLINEAYYMLIMLIMLLIKVNKRGSLSIFTAVAILGAGYSSIYFGGSAKWIFPMAHTIEYMHFAKVLRAPKMPIVVSVLYFVVLILVVFFAAFCSMKKYDFMGLDE